MIPGIYEYRQLLLIEQCSTSRAMFDTNGIYYDRTAEVLIVHFHFTTPYRFPYDILQSIPQWNIPGVY